MKGATFADEGT